jgi:glutaredoxin 3
VSETKPPPKSIRLFIKPRCGWCHQAVGWLDARRIRYETLDVVADSAAYQEMQKLSGQTFAPVIEVDGKILADFDVGQLAEFWKRFE